MHRAHPKFRKLCCGVLSVSLLAGLFGLLIPPQTIEAAEKVVERGPDQWPSPVADGAYWYNAVWSDLKQPNYNKSRVVEDRCLPARSFFIPARSEEEAMRGVDHWRESSTWQSLNGSWDFHLVRKPDEVEVNFHKADFDPAANGWGKIEVPSCWQLVPNEIGDEPMYSNWYYHWGQKNWLPVGEPNVPGERFNYAMAYAGTAPKNYNPVGHYIRDFELKSEYKNDEVILNFQGVESAFYVYVNGHYVGYSEDSFTQHEFDITKYVKPEGKNRLAVLVYRWSDGSLLENQDLVNYSGIFRDTGLIYRSKRASILDFSNEMTLQEDGSLRLDTQIKTSAQAKAVRMRLYDPQGQLVKTVDALDQVGQIFLCRIDVPQPQLWSTESPSLYHQVLEVLDEQGITEYVPWDVGLREISLLQLENGKTSYAINGQRIVFKGVNRHELNNDKGRVMTLETLHKDLQLMRQHNVNAIRCSHYPNNIDLYILADRYGLMIMDEANMETHAAGGLGGIPMAVETFRYPSIHRCANMFERDKNFSSVVSWSNGNECIFFAKPAVNDNYSFRLMYKYIKERDKQRPIVLERDPREGVSDIRSRMYWPASEHSIGYSVFEGIPGNDKKVLEDSDTRPYLQVEYAHSMGNSLGYYKEYWDLWRQYPHAMGGFIWDWVDQSPLWPLPEGKTATGPSYTADGTKVASGGTHYLAYGGDWAMDKNNNFNNFMDNGLVSSDRHMHHSHQQLKYVQQSILFSNYQPETGTVDVTNEFSFTPLSHYQLSLSVLKDGQPLTLKNGQTEYALNWELGPEAKASLQVPDLDEVIPQGKAVLKDSSALYHLKLEAKLKSDVGLWGKTGDSIAFEQFQLNKVDKNSLKVPFPTELKNHVEENEQYVAISNERLHFVLDKKLGQWTEFAKDGVNFFADPNDNSPRFLTTDKREMLPGMYANFWRAPVDNDRENGWLDRVARWREANFWRSSVTVTVDQSKPQFTTIQVTSKLDNNSDLTERYIVYADGQVHYEQGLDPTRRSEIPAIGAMIEMPKSFKQLRYFGRGPSTSFVDRWEGYPMGIYEETVDFNSLGDYVKPQENGNHVGVEWAQLSNEQGQGLFIKSSEGPLEVMASPYNQYDVTGAAHPYELQSTERSYLRINHKTAGVGGENSWGARALPYAEIEAKPYRYSFDIFPITGQAARANTSRSPRVARSLTDGESKPGSSMTYPESAPDQLYRVSREDSRIVISAKYRLQANEEFLPVAAFYESQKSYDIRNPQLFDLEPAEVQLELKQDLKDFEVRYSTKLSEDQQTKTVIATVVNKNLPSVQIAEYQFHFHRVQLNPEDLLAGADVQYAKAQASEALTDFRAEQTEYRLPYREGQILDEATAQLRLKEGMDKKYQIQYSEKLEQQGLLRVKTVEARIFPKDANPEQDEPLFIYRFIFQSNPRLDVEPTPEPSPTPTPQLSPTPTPQPSPTPSPEATVAPTPTSGTLPEPVDPSPVEPSPGPTASPTPLPTPSPEPTPTSSPAPTPTAAPSPSPSPAPTPTAAPSPGSSVTEPTAKPSSHLPSSGPSKSKPSLIPGYPTETQPRPSDMIPSGASTESSESLSPLPSSGPSGQVPPPSQEPGSQQQGSGKQSAPSSQVSPPSQGPSSQQQGSGKQSAKASQRLARTGEKAGLGFGLALLLFALFGLGLKAQRPEED